MKRLLAAAIVLCAMPAFAAVDAFIQIRGLQTQHPDASHPGWVGVSGFRWGATPPGVVGCASGELSFTLTTALMEEQGIFYFFKHSQEGHTMIPEVTIEYASVRHVLESAIVRSVGGNTVAIHFARCRTHPVPQVVPAGVVPNTTTGLVVPNTTPVPLNAQMRFDTGAQQFNLVSLRVTGLTAILKLRNESASFFQTSAANRTKYTKVVMQKDATTFTFSNCVISSYSHGPDGVDTIGLSFSIYSGPALGYP